MANALRDDNRVTTLMGVSSADGTTPIVIQVDETTGAMLVDISGGGSGDVAGPGTATDNAIARFDGTTGKLIQNSGITIDDSNNISGAAVINGTQGYFNTSLRVGLQNQGNSLQSNHNRAGITLGYTSPMGWSATGASSLPDTLIERSAAGVLDVNATDGGGGDGRIVVASIQAPASSGFFDIRAIGATRFRVISSGADLGPGVLAFGVALGSKDTYIQRGSAGVVDINSTEGGGGDGFLLAGVSVEANTAVVASPNVISGEYGKVFTNEGATAENVHTLPTAVAGAKYTFIVQDADGIQINANTGDTIRHAGTVSASAGLIESATIGNVVTLVAINATEWIVTNIVGSWTIT